MIGRFSVLDLLKATTFVALVICPVIKPSVWWAMLFPAASWMVAVYAISLFISTPERGRVFWGCFVSGVAAYLSATMFVGFIAFIGEFDFWSATISVPLWSWLHGTANSSEMNPYDFISFRISVHLVIAVALAGMGGIVVQQLAYRRHRYCE